MKTFDNIPTDPDTQILFERHVRIGGFDAVLQEWNWDGIKANSLIFHTHDVAFVSDENLKQLIIAEKYEGAFGPQTIKREMEHVFLNFNFRY